MQKVLILNYGGQYDQLIARRIRECHVFCEVISAESTDLDALRSLNPIGIILTGRPSRPIDRRIFDAGVPVLGVGSCCAPMAHALGGQIRQVDPVHGRTLTKLSEQADLFVGFPPVTISWMDYDQEITSLPDGFFATASTSDSPIVAFGCTQRHIYGTQFHPEAFHTEGGTQILKRFLKEICGAEEQWQMDNVISHSISEIRRRVGQRKVLLALSGGVDSSVAAALLSRAVGSQLTCIFVDHGMLRKDEGDQVEHYFSRMDLNFIRVNAQERFLRRLEGVWDPDEKRRVVGEEFVRVFEEEAKKIGHLDFLAQGTIYPDILEDGQGYNDVVRSSRDMGSLPAHIGFQELIEPLRLLFKDEVRQLGRTMGLPEFLVGRQPFPGPGLALRIVGPITREKITLLRQADHIFASELERAHMHEHIGQYFAVLTDTRLGRSGQEYCLALRAVNTDDFATAKWTRLPYELLDRISATIVQEVPGISRIVYDITSKPPATIEWQ
ncbi:MAG: glutamine-hydrolyzing GMP synthase [Oscillospiraceae bacterium]|nr:glutamine-hydrolyzing GMP synthase [Oscillospiraceae bacterium]